MQVCQAQGNITEAESKICTCAYCYNISSVDPDYIWLHLHDTMVVPVFQQGWLIHPLYSILSTKFKSFALFMHCGYYI